MSADTPDTPDTPDTAGSTDAAASGADAHREPALRVVSGAPAPEELAALVAVLSALGGGDATPEPPHRRSPWSDPSRPLVGARTGRDGWRTSALPR